MFHWKIYLHNYPDLVKDGIDTEIKVLEHWKNHGKKEKRIGDKLADPNEFNWVVYLNNYPDLVETNVTTEKEALDHWINHGKNENRIANKDIIGNVNKTKIKSNEISNEYIKFCLKTLKIMRLISLPSIKKEHGNLEAVFIEYNCLPYTEFIIRNAIFRLGEKWNHTVICGNLNYGFMKKMCHCINENIKVIKTNFDKMTENSYNKFLSSVEFWDLLHGSKILLYRNKSFFFGSNVDEFLNWDYIASPFSKLTTHCEPINIGNGGVTLRTREVMRQVISKISIEKTVFLKSTLEYIKKQNLEYAPENIYFSKNMQDLHIGKVADVETAKKFCVTIYPKNANEFFAGCDFWNYNKSWRAKMSATLNINSYEFGKNLDKYIEYNRDAKNPTSETNVKVVYERKNHFDIDFDFYKKVNQVNDSINIYTHFHKYGIINGLIYHPRQLLNIYPNLKFKRFLNEILIKKDDKYYPSKTFVKEFVYDKSFGDMEKILIKKEIDKMSPAESPLLILAFMGNENRGLDLFERIKNYKKIQTFNVAFCFNRTENFDILKKKIEDSFTHYSIYYTLEMGTDITPTLLMYSDIKKTHRNKFCHIIKLQTKSVSQLYYDLTNYLLNKPFSKLLEKKREISNCISEFKNYSFVNDEDIFNKILVEKYKSSIHFDYKFVKGTIFSCETKVFDAVLSFIQENNYHSYLLNNFYENNCINYDNSPVHYLERLFGVIRC